MFKCLWEWAKGNGSIIIPFGLVLLLIGVGCFDAAYPNYLIVWDFPEVKTTEVIMQKKITIREWVTLIIALAGVYFLSNRAKYQNKQVEIADKQAEIADTQAKIQNKQAETADRQAQIQSEQNLDQMFNAAVALLGSSETSGRNVAIYSLYYLASKNEAYLVQIAQILCSHIRSKTREKEYQEEHRDKPSNEIQTAIDLLFNHFPSQKQKGLYCAFKSKLPRADLTHAYLAGANFAGAHCEKVYFAGAHCEKANFRLARCQGAFFVAAYCQGADFIGANCQGANFHVASCEGAYFRLASCEGVYFGEAYCEGAEFAEAHCEGADFSRSHCEGAIFGSAYCEGADFSHSHCEGALFAETHCEGAIFSGAHCQEANFKGSYCQGSYAGVTLEKQKLVDRIGQETFLDNMIISGEFDKDAVIEIERAQRQSEKFLPRGWYSDMQKLINQNKGKLTSCGTPEGIKSGVLEDAPELRALIKKLQEIEE